jgi:alkanesulfonate monooxygenase
MTIEFIGYIGNHESSEIIPRSGPILDRTHVELVAQAYEAAGFDKALLAFHADAPEALLVGQHAASVTRKLGIFVAQRPGFTAPTVFARQFATLDNLYPGRFSINVITGADHKTELVRDGNTVADKDDRYARTNEFLDIVPLEWESDTPFDYNGRFYQVERAFSNVKPTSKGSVQIFVAGASDAAIEVAGRHADTFALWGETYEQVKELTDRVRAASARNGRPAPRFSLSLRPIIAETEDAAWAKAEAILEKAKALQDKTGYRRTSEPLNEGSKRLLAAAAKGPRLDKRLWTGIAQLSGAKGNSTSLVGTPAQVAETLVDYYDLGIETFLIRGFDPVIDAIEYGRELIPLTRKLIAERRQATSLAAE